MLERLIFDVRTFTQQKRIAFIDELLQRTNLHYYACELIPLFGDQKQINEIKKGFHQCRFGYILIQSTMKNIFNFLIFDLFIFDLI